MMSDLKPKTYLRVNAQHIFISNLKEKLSEYSVRIPYGSSVMHMLLPLTFPISWIIIPLSCPTLLK